MEILNPLDIPEWDKLVLASPGHSFFHTSSWARVLYDSYGYRPCYFARIQDGRFAVLLPMMEVRSFLTGTRGVSLPFTDYCEPIISSEGDWREVQESLQLYGEKNQWKHWELRGGEHLMGQESCSSSYYRHDLKLTPDMDALSAGVKSSTKRNIRKATREGVTVVRDNSLDGIKMFYGLHCLTRKKHGLPPQPFYFFQRLYDHVIRQDQGQFFFAKHGGRTIGGALYIQFGKEAIYKFGASDTRYLHLRPNDLVMWTAIHWYSNNGYTGFCFGRTEPDNDGLRQFKCGWGAGETVIRYYRYSIGKKEFNTEEASRAAIYPGIFRRMPIVLSTLVGKALYRHVG